MRTCLTYYSADAYFFLSTKKHSQVNVTDYTINIQDMSYSWAIFRVTNMKICVVTHPLSFQNTHTNPESGLETGEWLRWEWKDIFPNRFHRREEIFRLMFRAVIPIYRCLNVIRRIKWECHPRSSSISMRTWQKMVRNGFLHHMYLTSDRRTALYWEWRKEGVAKGKGLELSGHKNKLSGLFVG